MKTNFGIHLDAAIKAAGLSQLQFEKSSGIRQSTVNTIINMGRRPRSDTLASITGYDWPDDNLRGVSLLIEHLRDEINRSRLGETHPKTRITIEIHDTSSADIDTVLDSLRAHAQTNPDLARMLCDLLALLDEQERPNMLAAEPRANYDAKSRPKK